MHTVLKQALLLFAALAFAWPVANVIAADDEAAPVEAESGEHSGAEPSATDADHADGDDHGHAESGEDHAHDTADGHGDDGHGEDAAGHGHGADGHDEHHAGPASNHPLSIDPDLAIATLVIFVVLLVVLQKFAWGPIMEGLAVREGGIADNISAAAERRKDAEKMLSSYQSQLERAGEEVRAMLDGAKREAEAMKQSILEEASKAAAAEKEQATAEIQSAKDKAISEISGDSVNIAFRLASGALRRDINPDDHKELIADAGL